MATPSTPRPEHLDFEHEQVLDDQLEVDTTDGDDLPEHLDLPIDVPEADAIDQRREVPPNGDERR